MISPGSQWHRWEPHIHAPGTVLNDRFGGGDPWDVYLTKIEIKTPLIRALAVTDYYLSYGRNAHCCAPPAQIRTWSLNHSAPTSGA